MTPPLGLLSINVRQGYPDFLDLPWGAPLSEWAAKCDKVVEIQRGLSRHEVIFISVGKQVYALKELPLRVGQREYDALRALEEKELPSVQAVGLAKVRRPNAEEDEAVLITHFLEGSLPYRTVFMSPNLERYRDRLLDAMAILLVRLHLGGCFWGDCSLSNTLFRRDAGELQAYLVDAETSEVHDSLSAAMRQHDLAIMEENVAGGLHDLAAIVTLPPTLDLEQTGARIRTRYEQLWNEITAEVQVAPGDSFKIQERIRSLNSLGFTVGEVELVASADGGQLRMRTVVTDHGYHRHLLQNLTGIIAEERQATLLLNELQALKATLTTELNRSVPLSVAAYRWMEERFWPTTEKLQKEVRTPEDPPELYCQLLEHKWYLSEREKKDVGLQRATEDYLALRKRQLEEAAAAKPVTTDPGLNI